MMLVVVLVLVDRPFETLGASVGSHFISTRTDAGGFYLPRKRIVDLLDKREIADSIATQSWR